MHCDDKKRYFSEDEANETAEHQEKLNNIKLRSYHCQGCGWWHLTKNMNWSSFVKPNQSLVPKRKRRRRKPKLSFEDIFNKKNKYDS